MRTRDPRILVTLLLAATVGCEVPEPERQQGSIVVEAPLAIANEFKVLYDDWVTLHRISGGVTTHALHDRTRLTLTNIGDVDLVISDVELDDPVRFSVIHAAPPLTLAPGASTQVEIRFIESAGAKGTRAATLTLRFAGGLPPRTVTLRGLYMLHPENEFEVTFDEVARAMGITTAMPGPLGKSYVASGEEILSPWWRRLDPTQPLRVRQLAALHRCCWDTADFAIDAASGGGFFWHAFSHGQTLFPPIMEGPGPAALTLTPSEPFQPKVAGFATSDGARGLEVGIRIFPVRGRDGENVPGTYFVVQDYVIGPWVNFDFNDNLYIVTNITPDPVVYRLNAGGPDLTENGQLTWWAATPWLAATDVATLEPTGGDGSAPADVYRSYVTRGSPTSSNPETLALALPVDDDTYDVILHLVEPHWTTAGMRRFSVEVEGTLRVVNLDVAALTGGALRTTSHRIEAVPVEDGLLEVRLIGRQGAPVLSGLEVVRSDDATVPE